ncbi:hypothetical protein CcaverHIS002_0301150 [Cutaneotrichosporon cavernicola]|uniref:Microbial-type PARG catalytic domain-containing protein n=1 Tax=Cutaneotrichosporon cavernicola TaxID=279322 RepID=A0AA48I2S2_9TREE|nr:uncharacterized protein CcaverHIS019_0301110 [Cutaneotrichosporon cavernicola]BEI82247.1 hypothetical protein CcaverHIS002_0301150 [Cutaneotrichosporon cavernicola]BEI90041.1 hypothetical protein CcaverHIS019_0301110 [Cutaneotrichosporon cavernicola]BEI97815.1 hypothetical protein CcaverHIS631_0301140 [Cutaneotrichosporon cavernicola]BEJ05593.1 hypothetical protein CcaverHIS641_0301150 [Cutaneotrichosporon cavernicola]
MSRTANKAFSSQNEAFIKQGWYPSPTTGGAVDLSSLVSAAKHLVTSYDEAATEQLLSVVTCSPNPNKPTTLTVTAETSSAAAERLHAEGAPRIAVLNFASARNPGGGYMNGATAQEEDICRSSALYTTLLKAPDFYAAHQHLDGRYTHRMIYSPSVPMFRTSKGDLLPFPYTVDFITSAAPNYGALENKHPHRLHHVPRLLRERAARILALCAYHGAQTLVLGAWGCGVFRNSPAEVAKVFHDLLKPGGAFHGRFNDVVFAIYDRSRTQEVMGPFMAEFTGTTPPHTPRRSHASPKRSADNGSARRSSRDIGPPGSGSDRREARPSHDKPAPADGQARITSFFQPKRRDG